MEDKRIVKLLRNLDKTVEKECNGPITVAFSGGIDSTLVAFLSKKYCEVELIAVGIANSHDIKAAKSAAKLINCDLKIIEVEQTEMVSEALEMQKHLDLSSIDGSTCKSIR